MTYLMANCTHTTLCKQSLSVTWAGRWFSPCTPVSSTKKIDRRNITKMLLKVALNTITLTLLWLTGHLVRPCMCYCCHVLIPNDLPRSSLSLFTEDDNDYYTCNRNQQYSPNGTSNRPGNYFVIWNYINILNKNLWNERFIEQFCLYNLVLYIKFWFHQELNPISIHWCKI